MAFTFTKNNETIYGDMRITSGTYTNSSSTGGDIYTGLQNVNGMILQQKGAAVVATQAVITAGSTPASTFPKADPVTIITINNGAGYWEAWGV